MQKAIPTFYNKPVLSFYDNKKKDMDGHNAELDYDMELDQVYFDYTNGKSETPLGVIRDSDLVEIVNYKDQNWVKFTCALWIKYGYKQIKKMLKDSRKQVSVEVEVLDSHVDEQGIEVIDDFIFDGVTILGQDVTEAIPGAHATILDALSSQIFQKKTACLSFAYKQLSNNTLKNDKKKFKPDFQNPIINEKVGEIQMEDEVKEQKGGERVLTYNQKRDLLSAVLEKTFEREENSFWVRDLDENYVYFYLNGETFKANYSIDEETNEAFIDFENKSKVIESWKDYSEDKEDPEEDDDKNDEDDKKDMSKEECECKETSSVEDECKNSKEECECKDNMSEQDGEEGNKECESSVEDECKNSVEDECKNTAEEECKNTNTVEDECKNSVTDKDITDGQEVKVDSPSVGVTENPAYFDKDVVVSPDVYSTITFEINGEKISADKLIERFSKLQEDYNNLEKVMTEKTKEEYKEFAKAFVEEESDLSKDNASAVINSIFEEIDKNTFSNQESLQDYAEKVVALALYSQKKESKSNSKIFSSKINKETSANNSNNEDNDVEELRKFKEKLKNI